MRLRPSLTSRRRMVGWSGRSPTRQNPRAVGKSAMKPLVSYWILDFALRQFTDQSLLEDLFSSLPFPLPCLLNSRRLRKAILLRYLRNIATVSEKELHALELIDELDRDCIAYNDTEPKPPPLPSLKVAYCAVAVECTVRHLRDRSYEGFSSAVSRIWNRRVADLQASDAANGLFSRELKQKTKQMKKAVADSNIRDRLLRDFDTRATALEAIKAYADDALAEMGPSLLELKAEAVLRKGGELGHGLLPSDETAILEEGADDRPPSQLVRGGRMAMPPPPEKPAVENNAASFERAEEQHYGEAVNKDKMSPVPPPAATQKRNVTSKFQTQEHDFLSTPAAKRLKQALRSSCAVLHTAVEDPLPGAIAKAAELVDKAAENTSNANGQEHILNGGVGDPGPSTRVMHASRSHGTTLDEQDHVDPSERVRSSLMDRNPTAHTTEWTDSIDSFSEESPSISKKIRLPSQTEKRASPLNIPKPAKYSRRRAIKKWSVLEEDTLREGVKKHGKGNWKFILNCYPSIFEHRTEVDLKDKWRNMTRHGHYTPA